ncbi:GNAT family N-acetyltransferase [Filobacillus milosensis]|uniref:GNAT family N-acetyltransferase n=1 Tax=Filobacillus milosensis TaxID=94137 RepID=A0A4Y8IRW4_9BACI|nr:GNAT family N-acetyltransferase [Filobacillus milosensis]TFB24415.1 GNAT family N-acetyltransferase [Filobacillus milosensis]
MKYKNLTRKDSKQIVECWNRNIGNLFPMTEKLFIQNSLNDYNLDPDASIVIKDGELIVGFIIAKHYQESIDFGIPSHIANIQVLLVDKEYRQQGIGKNLLNKCLDTLSKKGKKEVRLGRDTWHYFPGVPVEYEDTRSWFEKQGFSRGRYIDTDMSRSFSKDEPFEQLQNPDADFSILKPEDQDELCEFMKANFPGRWDYEVNKYFELGGTGRDFVVLRIDGAIQGFCRMNDEVTPFIGCNVNWAGVFDGKVGGIGPLGVNKDVRGNGLGLDVVKAGMNTLRERGIDHIIIDWTGLVDFYKKVGFDVFKQYGTYYKKLT